MHKVDQLKKKRRSNQEDKEFELFHLLTRFQDMVIFPTISLVEFNRDKINNNNNRNKINRNL